MLVARKRASSSGDDGRGDGERSAIEKVVKGRLKCDVGAGVSAGRAPERANSCARMTQVSFVGGSQDSRRVHAEWTHLVAASLPVEAHELAAALDLGGREEWVSARVSSDAAAQLSTRQRGLTQGSSVTENRL